MPVIPAAAEPLPPSTPGTNPARTDLHGDPLPAGALARMGTARLRHGERVAALAFTPDGRRLISGGYDFAVRVWDVKTGRQLDQLRESQPQVDRVFVLPDGKTLVTATRARSDSISVWDLSTGRRLRRLKSPRRFGCTASADGKVLASWCFDHKIRLWDPTSGAELRQIEAGREWVTGLALSRDGKVLASHEDGQIRLRDVATGKELGHFPFAEDVMALAFSPQGKVLAAAVQNTVRLLDAETGKELHRLAHEPGRYNLLTAIAFSPDGKLLASGGPDDFTVRVWDVATGKETHRFSGHTSSVLSVAFAPDGKTLASGGWDNTVRLWNLATNREIHPFPGHQHGARVVAFAPDGKTLASGGSDQTVRLWEAATGKERKQFPGRAGFVQELAFSPDGKMLASSADGPTQVRFWDVGSGRPVPGLDDLPDARRAVAFSPDGRFVVAVDARERVTFWDRADGKKVRSLDPPGAEVVSRLAFAPDGKTLAGAAYRGNVQLWDVASGKAVRGGVRVNSFHVLSLAFSPDGESLAAVADDDWLIYLWETATGKERRRFVSDWDYPQSVAFSTDGKRLISGGRARVLRVWEVATGKESAKLPGHQGVITSVAAAPDGRTVASGSEDTTALTWGLDEWSRLTRLAAPGDSSATVEAWWADLAGSDAARAYQAMWALVGQPERAIPFLKAHLKPAKTADPERIAGLIADLDSDRFETRENAMNQLAKLGELAEGALRKILAERPAVEVRRRVEIILQRLDGPVTSPERLQVLRAIEVLEHIGTPRAIEVLETLAGGVPEFQVTVEARKAVGRLNGMNSVLRRRP